MAEYWNFERLTQEWTSRGLDRRQLMKLIAGGAGLSAIMTLMGTHPQRTLAQDSSQDSAVSMLWQTPVTLSPLFSTAGFEQQVERLVFGALVKMNDALIPTPDLAESIEISDDAMHYTFHLHQNITFNDGEPLTAKDVVFTFERAIDKRTGSFWRSRLLGIEGAEEYGNQQAETITGIQIPDDYTVKISFIRPNATFLVTLADFSGFGILPEHILRDVAPDQIQQHAFSVLPTVSAGAYAIGEFKTDQYLELVRNDNYFGEPPAIDKIYLQILTPDVGLAKLETGELNLTSLSTADADHVRALDGVTVVGVPSPSVTRLIVNFQRPYLQSKELRQAMMYAIDRASILEQFFQGEGEVVNSPIFGPEWMGVPEGLNPYEFDPDKARALLESSGYDPGQKIELMVFSAGGGNPDPTVTIIQQQLRDVGFNFELLMVDRAELNRRYINESDFDLALIGGGMLRADPSVSGGLLTTEAFTPTGGNAGHYSNPELDELYLQGQATSNEDERREVYTRIAQTLNDELPWISLWSPNSLFAFTNNLQGFAPPSYGDNKLWNAETWTLADD